MSSEKKLPDGWVLCHSKSKGKTYYFNRRSGLSSWTKPEFQTKKRRRCKKHIKQEENEKEKKNYKRKSEECISKEESVPEKKLKPPIKPQTKASHAVNVEVVTKKPSPTKCGPNKHIYAQELKTGNCSNAASTKNSAALRLATFRSMLESEVDTTKTPKTDAATQKTDKNSTMSEKSQPMSQFLQVSKIISSIRAQLPRGLNGEKVSNTFDFIEESIRNQVSEYSTRLPTTPPQFSEASKIVEGIKTKLTPKKECKRYSSASERMESLRMENAGRASETPSLNTTDSAAHGVYRQLEERKQVVPMVVDLETPAQSKSMETTELIMKSVVLVVDTNLFIHDLDFIKTLVTSHIKGFTELPTLLVPWRVIKELDGLKDNNNGKGALSYKARAAMEYLYQMLPQNGRIRGQSLRDANSHIYPCEVFDDEILNCCLQEAQRGNSVMLVSNDKNLCNKATINNIRSANIVDLKALLTDDKPQQGHLADIYKKYERSMYELLANILETEMRAEYDCLWKHLLFKTPPWSLLDVLRSLLKHWIAVFSVVFPVKNTELLLEEMKSIVSRVEMKGAKVLTQTELDKFRGVCLEICTVCQLLPEYMEQAKSVAAVLNSDTTQEEAANDIAVVIDAFENVWTILSSYCAKLATCLGINHNIDDNLPSNDNLETLKGKWPVFSKEIQTLTLALKGVVGVQVTDPSFGDQIANLELVFKECLALINLTSNLTRNSLKNFCCNRRNMLQEAYNKFTHLIELLAVCCQHMTCM